MMTSGPNEARGIVLLRRVGRVEEPARIGAEVGPHEVYRFLDLLRGSAQPAGDLLVGVIGEVVPVLQDQALHEARQRLFLS